MLDGNHTTLSSTTSVVVAPPSVTHKPLDRAAADSTALLSVELLTEIFQFGLAIAQRDHQQDVFLSRIISVCWRWREIASDTACLWTRIHFELPRGDRHLFQALVTRTRTILEMSKAAPIDIAIVFPDYHQVDIMIFRDLFHSHLHRCRHLRITAPYLWCTKPFFPLPESLSLLSTLGIVVQGGYCREVDLFGEDVHTPHLRMLCVQGHGTRGLRKIDSVSAQLTRVSLGVDVFAPYWSRDGAVLGPGSMVEKLELISLDQTPLEWCLHDPITLSKVEYLRLAVPLGERFWERLIMPNLEHLEIAIPRSASSVEDGTDSDDPDFSGLAIALPDVSLITPRPPPSFKLFSLSLGTGLLSTNYIVPLFLSQPSVLELSLKRTWSIEYLKVLAITPDASSSSGHLLPELKVIKISHQNADDDLESDTYGPWFLLEVVGMLLNLLDRRPDLNAIWEEEKSRWRDERVWSLLEAYRGRVTIVVT